MTVRTGMANLITRTRRLIYDLDSSVFTDDEIQDVLDQYVQRFRQAPLSFELTYSNSAAITYQDFNAPFGYGDWEEDAVFQSASYVIITPDADTSSYISGHWHFSVSYPPPVYMALGKTYDLYAAASVLCTEYAARYPLHFDATQAGTSMARSQKFKQMSELAAMYASRRRVQQIKGKRTDLGAPTMMPDWTFRDANKTPRTP